MFAGLFNLHELLLARNKISTISFGTFTDLGKLQEF